MAELEAEEVEVRLLDNMETLAMVLICLKGCLNCPDIIVSAAAAATLFDGRRILGTKNDFVPRADNHDAAVLPLVLAVVLILLVLVRLSNGICDQ